MRRVHFSVVDAFPISFFFNNLNEQTSVECAGTGPGPICTSFSYNLENFLLTDFEML